MAKYNNDKADKPLSVNTFSYTDKNYETETAVAVKFFDSMSSISIHLPKEGDKADQVAFDWDHGVIAYLGVKECKLLSKKGYKALEKFEETGEFKTVSIPLKKGVVEILTVGNLKKKMASLVGDDVNPDLLCLTIYTDINESKIPQSFLVHVFNVGRTLEDFQPTNGKYKMVTDMTVECEYFLDSLKEFAKGMTNGLAHAIKNDGKYQRDKFEKMAYELAISLGVDLSKSSGKSNAAAGPKSLNWGSAPRGDAGIGSRNENGYKTETIDANEENVDEIINSMIAGE